MRRTSGQRVQWGFVDQAVSSLTNFAIGLVVARLAAPREFGTFSLAFTLYLTLLWVSRSLTTEPFVVRLTAAGAEKQRTAASRAVGAASAMGLIAAGVVGSVGLAGSPLSGRILGAMALSMPGLLAQDSFRYVLFAAGRARSAAVNDLVWLFIEAVLIVGLFGTGHATTTALVAAFGLSASVAALVGSWQTKVVPSLADSYRWVRDNRDLAVPFVLELLTVAGMIQIGLLVVSAIIGAEAIGALRAAMLLMGPLTVLFLGVFVIAVPEAIRFQHRSLSVLPRMVTALGLAMPVVTFVWAGAIMLLPERLGRALLRSNWGPGRHVLPAVAFLIAAHAFGTASVVGLRALGAAKRSLGARLWGAPVFLAGGVIGSVVGGAYGAGVGLAGAGWIDAFLVWLAFRHALRARNESL
ncbi:MAG: hypothetical protein M3083_08140 [Actinomycetota bacterium]|nr:hypothetical protein [Actinomycetota bacterium]